MSDEEKTKKAKRQALNEASIQVATTISYIAAKYGLESAQLGDALAIALVAASQHDEWRDFFGLSQRLDRP